MKIKTCVLKAAISKVTKGASNNSLLPITSLMSIDYNNNQLNLVTTDGTNQFKVTIAINEEDIISIDNFYTVVNVITFAKLVDKTSKEYIELNIKENYLEFIGNGRYKLEIALNDSGEVIKFLDINTIKFEKEYDINIKDLQDALKTAKASTLKSNDMPILTGYYVGKYVLTTDRQLVCKVDKKIIDDSIVLSAELANFLLLLDIDEIFECKLKINSTGSLLFVTNKYIIYGMQLEGKDTFENGIIPAIDKLLSLEYSNTISVNKNELLTILDRLSLFTNYFDDETIKLIFKKDLSSIELQSLQTSASEDLNLLNGTIDADFECLINIDMLRKQIKSLVFDEVNIQYGGQKSIQINEANVTLVIALINSET